MTGLGLEEENTEVDWVEYGSCKDWAVADKNVEKIDKMEDIVMEHHFLEESFAYCLDKSICENLHKRTGSILESCHHIFAVEAFFIVDNDNLLDKDKLSLVTIFKIYPLETLPHLHLTRIQTLGFILQHSSLPLPHSRFLTVQPKA